MITTTPASPEPEAWGRWGRAAGFTAGGAFLVQTVLFLLDATGALAPRIPFVTTPAGVMEDLATYYVAVNERMHTIWWDVALRDTLGPIAYLALTVLFLSVVRATVSRHPRDQLAVLLVMLGGILGALNDLMYLSYTRWWFSGGFRPTPDIVSFGVTADALDNLGTYFQRSGFLLLAAGFLLLAPTLGRLRTGWRWLRALARLEAAAVVAWVVTDVAETGTTRLVASIAAGVVLGPALSILAGLALATRRLPTRRLIH
ncbi:MAG: hypothetical protein JWP61_1977 [Friedmanniella sp.]|nr:hypothetical protein [Friedmanniella sp.]